MLALRSSLALGLGAKRMEEGFMSGDAMLGPMAVEAGGDFADEMGKMGGKFGHRGKSFARSAETCDGSQATVNTMKFD